MTIVMYCRTWENKIIYEHNYYCQLKVYDRNLSLTTFHILEKSLLGCDISESDGTIKISEMSR